MYGKTDEQTLRVKIVITTGCDCGSAKWINTSAQPYAWTKYMVVAPAIFGDILIICMSYSKVEC